MKFIVKNIEDLKQVIKCIDNSNKKIILLNGTLGSGKTTLVKEFLKYKGIQQSATSPTFSIQNRYEDVYHYDVYQKKDEFLSLGMIEELEKEGYHFIEWGEEIEDILKNLGFEYLKINIKVNGDKREIECQD